MRLKSLEKRGKRIALAFLRPLARGRPLAQGDLVDRRLKQILVVRQDERLGNLILQSFTIYDLPAETEKACL
jgi:hypothetical protein